MTRIRQTISFALVLVIASMGFAAQAQRRPYRLNDRQVEDAIRRVETSTDRFRTTLASSLDRSRLNGTAQEDEINRFVQSFEASTDQLRDRFNRRVSVAADVENVLRQAAEINNFLARTRLSQRVSSDWALVRSDLDMLARAYSVSWRWDQSTLPGPVGPDSGRPYRISDRQLDAIIRRVENGADRFRTVVDSALDRSVYDGTRAENNINQFIRDFETATDQLRSRFDGRRSVASDVENVLRQATYIDDFMRRNRLNQRAANEWSTLRTDLNELATAYSVAWNWSNPGPFPQTGGNFPQTGGNFPQTGGGTALGGRLTGTYRLDPTRGDNARDIAERTTQNLPEGERQRVFDRLMARLDSPEMLAIDKNGSRVTIASSRAPQTTFDADGVERREQLPNGSYSRVTTRLNGDQLVVQSTGMRETDFTVTFDPTENGRRLRVTREIWSERLGQNPVVVRNVYDRTSDVADFSIFSGTPGAPPTQTGEYIVRNGERLLATLETNLTSQTTQSGDRFTMTVREPSHLRGAVIEGRVANVARSGRVTGRSELALNFDNIRMPDGRTYQFAGLIESVRTPGGETVRVDNEGTVRDDDSRGSTTAQRAAIGTAVGAIIGAIAGGGKGAAIGAIIGAAGGAGSVYVQGREDIELQSGTEFNITASAPNR